MIGKAEFKQLFDEYFDTIRSFIFYRCGDADVASDIAQNVFMKVWEKREQLCSSYLKSLLYKIANDMVISNYRKDECRSNFERCMMPRNNHALSPEEEMQYREVAAKYARVLEQMSEAQRTVFLMSRNDELKYHEIAERLDISVKTVEKRMSATLQLLRAELL